MKIEDKIYGDELIVRGPADCFNNFLQSSFYNKKDLPLSGGQSMNIQTG